MADKFSNSKRREIMSRIAGKETKPEVLVRKNLFALGLRYRKNVKALPDTPDIVLKKYKVVIFVHGCFWHGHKGCKKANLPETNNEFWKSKIEKNIERDRESMGLLLSMGWRVIVIWQCEISNLNKLKVTTEKVIRQIVF